MKWIKPSNPLFKEGDNFIAVCHIKISMMPIKPKS